MHWAPVDNQIKWKHVRTTHRKYFHSEGAAPTAPTPPSSDPDNRPSREAAVLPHRAVIAPRPLRAATPAARPARPDTPASGTSGSSRALDAPSLAGRSGGGAANRCAAHVLHVCASGPARGARCRVAGARGAAEVWTRGGRGMRALRDGVRGAPGPGEARARRGAVPAPGCGECTEIWGWQETSAPAGTTGGP